MNLLESNWTLQLQNGQIMSICDVVQRRPSVPARMYPDIYDGHRVRNILTGSVSDTCNYQYIDTRVYILPVSHSHVDVELVTRRAQALRGTSGPGAVLRRHWQPGVPTCSSQTRVIIDRTHVQRVSQIKREFYVSWFCAWCKHVQVFKMPVKD